ncbi:MAG: ATP-binding protein [Kangiellaceae bacterium]|nr:ATP-binding protein [Kangiellaceae bacterium]MCW8998846.1 ATP-binding protein [Kangiellaceae bacterium]
MKLKLVEPFLSFLRPEAIENIELPDFAVITGLNGSGKSQLLKGIMKGNVQYGDIQPGGISLISFDDLNEKQVNAASIKNLCDEFLRGHSHNNVKWNNKITEIYRKYLAKTDANTHHYILDQLEQPKPVWKITKEDVDSELWDKIEKFKSEMEFEVFANEEFRVFGFHHLIEQTYKKFFIVTKERGASYSQFVDVIGALTLGDLTNQFQSYAKEQEAYVKEQVDADRSGRRTEWELEFQQHTPKPWELLNNVLSEIRDEFKDKNVFNFKITHPDMHNIVKKNGIAQIYDPATESKIEFENLSSGERVIFTLIMMAFGSRKGSVPPRLLLVDEIDATLHPSMIKVMLRIIENVFLKQGSKVILATHSATTVSLIDDEDAIHVIHHGQVSEKIEAVSKNGALHILTEGYVTLNQGTLLLNTMSDKPICILTEGNNAKIIKNYLALREVEDVEVVENSEIISRTGSTQLRSYFEFLKIVQHDSSALVIWDCDCLGNRKINNYEEAGNTFGLILPQNEENTIVIRGIENALPESVFDGFTVPCPDKQGTPLRFDGDKKAEFAEFLSGITDINTFSHFDCIFEKLEEIRRIHSEF